MLWNWVQTMFIEEGRYLVMNKFSDLICDRLVPRGRGGTEELDTKLLVAQKILSRIRRQLFDRGLESIHLTKSIHNIRDGPVGHEGLRFTADS